MYPLPLGFTADVATFATVWSLAFLMARSGARFRRRRRGLCPRCAYDLRHNLSSGCPECGWNRPIAPLATAAPATSETTPRT